jgi:NAD(P)-dependent dehydrogenase (short-subunit alcohol dehydrogenase family)
VRAVAVELAQNNVRVNVVSPGVIDTPMLGPSGAPQEEIGLGVAMNHGGTADDVAKGVMFIAENEFDRC